MLPFFDDDGDDEDDNADANMTGILLWGKFPTPTPINGISGVASPLLEDDEAEDAARGCVEIDSLTVSGFFFCNNASR